MSRATNRWPGKVGRPYVQVPVALLRHAKTLGIDDGDLRLLIALEGFRRGGAEDAVFPGQDRLADLCGCSISRIERRVAKLRKLGLIEVEREDRGGRRHNRYTRHGLTARLGDLEVSYPSLTRGSGRPSYPSSTRGGGAELAGANAGSYPAPATARYPVPTPGEVEAVREAEKQMSAAHSARARSATQILAIFNEQRGTAFGAASWLELIADRMAEHPELALDDYREVVETAFRRRWWGRDSASPSVIFKSAQQFERALAERGPNGSGRRRFHRFSPVETQDGATPGGRE